MDSYPINVSRPQPKLPIFIAVVVIIFVLAVILIPPFASARSKARATTCIYNLKQQAVAVAQYTQDWDETLPAANVWMDQIKPAMKNEENQTSSENSYSNLLQCPEAAANYDGSVKVVYGYAYNSGLSRLKMDKLNLPATAVMIFDSSTILKNAADPFTSIQSPGRHYGGDSVAFTDGHVKWVNHDSIEAIRKAMEETEPWFKQASTNPTSAAAH